MLFIHYVNIMIVIDPGFFIFKYYSLFFMYGTNVLRYTYCIV